jgi:hypothetical protein
MPGGWKKAGVGREQAEAHAAIMSEMILVEVATKADIDQATAALGQELRTETKVLGQQLRSEMELMRAGLDRRIDKLDEKVDRIQDRLTIRMGGMFVVSIGIVAALQKLL